MCFEIIPIQRGLDKSDISYKRSYVCISFILYSDISFISKYRIVIYISRNVFLDIFLMNFPPYPITSHD